MTSLPTVDLLTPCRNRVEHLRDSLPSWLACEQIRRVVVVDFNSTTPVIEHLGPLADGRVTVVRVDEEPLWRQGRAQNVGLGLVDADLLLKIDADVSIVDLRPYVEAMAGGKPMFFKGFSKLGTSSGLCLAPTAVMRAAGGYHDHMSGWGGDDVDFYQRLGKRGLKRQFFRPESFREQTQSMAIKNKEVPQLDSQLIRGYESQARNPFFTGFRNTVLARVQRQTRRRALRWRYHRQAPTPNQASTLSGSAQLVQARLRKPRNWRLKLSRHATELANILALAHFDQVASPWELIDSDVFQQALSRHNLPRWRGRKQRQLLLRELPERLDALRESGSRAGSELHAPAIELRTIHRDHRGATAPLALPPDPGRAARRPSLPLGRRPHGPRGQLGDRTAGRPAPQSAHR